MTVRPAKRAASDWCIERSHQLPDFAGAFLSGSTPFMKDEDPFPLTSDVDLCVVLTGEGHNAMVEVEGEFREQAILYRGVDLQPYYSSLRSFEDPEAILGSLESFPFQRTSILIDPTGKLTLLQREVAARYRQERWVTRRCEAAQAFAIQCIDWASGQAPPLPGYATRQTQFLISLYTGAFPAAAQIPCVADLGRVTSRKAFVASREVLRAQHMPGLYDEILAVSGTQHLTQAQVGGFVRELEGVYGHAVRIIRTPFWSDLGFQPFIGQKVFDGAWELVNAGDHREAMPFILYIRALAQNVLENDAPEHERTLSRRGFAEILAAVGITSEPDIAAKGGALRQLLPKIASAARTIADRNPAIERG